MLSGWFCDVVDIENGEITVEASVKKKKKKVMYVSRPQPDLYQGPVGRYQLLLF